MVAGEQKARQFAQRIGVDAERGERGQRFFGELLGQCLCGIQTEQGRVGRFLVELIGTGLFAEHGGIANDIEHIVVDLEGEAEPVGVAVEGGELLWCGLRGECPHGDGAANQRAGLVAMHGLQRCQIQMLAFGGEVLVLPDDNSKWRTPGGRKLAAANLLPRAEAALRQELQRLADAAKRARQGQSSSSSGSRAM